MGFKVAPRNCLLHRLFVEANSVMVASWEVLTFQIVVSRRALFNLGVLSRILSAQILAASVTPFVSKSHIENSMRVAINRRKKNAFHSTLA